MFGLAYKFIKNSKKYFISIIIILSLSILINTFVFFIFESLENKIITNNINTYGAHHAIIFNIKDEQYDGLKQENYIDKICKLNISKEYQLESNEKIIISNFDSQMLNSINLKLEKGNWPNNNNEIVIEESKLSNLYTNYSVGDSIKLISDNGKEKTFKLSGIIKNYSGYYNIAVENNNILPQAFVCSLPYSSVIYSNAVIKLKKFDESNIYDICYKQNIDIYSISINSKTYVEGFSFIYYIRLFKLMYFIVLFCSTILVFSNIYYLYFIKLSYSYKILFYIGIKKSKLLALIVIQYLMLFFISVVSVILISFFMFKKSIFIINVYNILSMTLIFLTTIFIILKCFYKYLNNKLKNKHFNMNINKSIKLNLTRFNISYSFNNTIMILLAFVIICISTMFTLFYISDIKINDSQTLPNYFLNTNDITSYKMAGNFQVYEPNNNYFTNKDIDLIDKNNLKAIVKYPHNRGVCMMLDYFNNRQYWEQWINKSIYNDIQLNKYKFENNNVINNLKILVLNNKEIDMLDQQTNYKYNILHNEKNVLLFLPPMNYDGRVLYNDILKPNDSVRLGRLESSTSILNITNDNDLNLIYDNFKIGEIYNEPVNIVLNGINIYNDVPTIIISSDSINASTLFNGYEQLEIYCYDDYNDLQLENDLKNVLLKYQGGYYFSLKDEIKNNKEIIASIIINLFVVIAISIFYVLVSFITMLNIKFNMLRKNVKIMFCLGLSRKSMISIISLEIFFYIILITVMPTIIMLLLFAVFNVPITLTYICMYCLMYFFMYVIILFVIIIYLFIKRFKLKDFLSSISND